MAQKLNIDRIWWRNVQPGEFYNIERYPQIEGGGGSLYIEIPSSMVPSDAGLPGRDRRQRGCTAGHHDRGRRSRSVRGSSGPIEFQRKKGSRNAHCASEPPADRTRSGTLPGRPPAASRPLPTMSRNKEEALPYFPEGGLRIYIAKTVEGDYYAGFTKGPRPASMKPNHPMWDLYPQGKIVGGVIDAD